MSICIKTHQFKEINAIIKRIEDYLISETNCSPDLVSAKILFWADNEFSIEVHHTECSDPDQNPISSKNKDFRHVIHYSERTKKYRYETIYVRDLIKSQKPYPAFIMKKLKCIKGVLQ